MGCYKPGGSYLPNYSREYSMLSRLPETIAFFLTLIALSGAMFLVPRIEEKESRKRRWIIIDREFIELSEEEAEEVIRK